MNARNAAVVLGGAVLALGCSSKKNPNSTVVGTVDLALYPSTPAAVVAIDEKGHATSAALDKNGNFSLVAPKHHRYRIVVAAGNREMPIVYPRLDGRLPLSFAIETGSAHVNLGRIRYLANAGPTSFEVTAPVAPSPACVNGQNPSTGALCVADSARATCDDDSEYDGEDDGEFEDGVPIAAPPSAAADTAIPGQEVAVPENDPAEPVTGCDDNNEQEGEN
jgi:hypothetical protein